MRGDESPERPEPERRAPRGPNRATRRAYRKLGGGARSGTRKGPRHPLAAPLDEYGTPWYPAPLVDEVRRMLS